MQKVIEWDQECEACGATGIYVGFAERDGFGVVCSRCEGSGKQEMKMTYTPFRARKRRKGMRRVLQINPGIGVGRGKEKEYALDAFGGMTYEMWWEGFEFLQGQEMRKFTCPAWWYQSADYKKKPDWDECGGMLGRSFSACEHFPHKNGCWDRFDQEQKD